MTPAELLAWRTQADLSQAGLAAILGVDRQTVYRWEHGERSIPSYLELALITLAHSTNVPCPRKRPTRIERST